MLIATREVKRWGLCLYLNPQFFAASDRKKIFRTPIFNLKAPTDMKFLSYDASNMLLKVTTPSLQRVPCIVSPNNAAFPHKSPPSFGTSRDICHAHCYDTKTPCSLAHAPGLSLYLKYKQRAVKELLHEHVSPDTPNK